MSKRVLVIAAHPDDELLGCGGTLGRHACQEDEVHVLIICEGESLRYKNQDAKQSLATERAGKILGVKSIMTLQFPDQRLDTFCLLDIISPIEKTADQIKPNIVYCQYGGDVNRDHKIVFEAMTVALRPVAEYVEEIYAYYTVGSTEWGYPRDFVPDTWVDISDYLSKKVDAFSCYESEIREYPHPRSIQAIKNLAYYTGNQCCMEAAEAFMTVRRIMR